MWFDVDVVNFIISIFLVFSTERSRVNSIKYSLNIFPCIWNTVLHQQLLITLLVWDLMTSWESKHWALNWGKWIQSYITFQALSI
jgi:hypothetical protein